MKNLQCVCILLLVSVCVCAGASYEIGEQVTQLAAMHDYRGGAYVLYVQNGQLKALYEDAAGNISPYRIFEEDTFSDAEVISLHNLSNGYYNAVVAVCRENGKTLLRFHFVYSFQPGVMTAEIPLDAEILDLIPVFHADGTVLLYVRTENAFLAVTVSVSNGNIKTDMEVLFYTQNTITESYAYRYGINDSTFGYYSEETKNGKNLYFFEHNTVNGLHAVYFAGNFDKNTDIGFYVSQNRNALYIIDQPMKKEIYEGKNFSFTKSDEYQNGFIKPFLWFNTPENRLSQIMRQDIENFCGDTVQNTELIYIIPAADDKFAVIFEGSANVQSLYIDTSGIDPTFHRITGLEKDSQLLGAQYVNEKIQMVTYDISNKLLTKWDLQNAEWQPSESCDLIENNTIEEKMAETGSAVYRMTGIIFLEKHGGLVIIDYENITNPEWISCSLYASTTVLNNKMITVFYDGNFISSKRFGR